MAGPLGSQHEVNEQGPRSFATRAAYLGRLSHHTPVFLRFQRQINGKRPQQALRARLFANLHLRGAVARVPFEQVWHLQE